MLNRRLIFLVIVVALLGSMVNAEVLYVDDTNGNDAYPGTEDKPLRSIARAAVMVNNSKKPGRASSASMMAMPAKNQTSQGENVRSIHSSVR